MGTAGTGLTLLVVDDDPHVRGFLTAALGRLGHTVLVAASGPEAVDLVRRQQGEVDAVLLDVLMGGMDGPETLAALRAVAPAVPCCFMTGNPGRYTADGLLALGAARVFAKPLDVALLDVVLRRLAAGRPSEPPREAPNP